MTATYSQPQSFSNRVIALTLVVLMVPLSTRGYAQVSVTPSIPMGLPLTASNSTITEVKPPEPIQPITSTSVDGDTNTTNSVGSVVPATQSPGNDTPEKLIADIDVAMSTLDHERDQIPKPEHSSTSAVLSENLNFLTKEISTRCDLIKRIDSMMEQDQSASAPMQDKYKTTISEYRNRLTETLKNQQTYFNNLDYELRKRAKDNASHESDLNQTNQSVATETPVPVPTPSETPWYATPEAKKTWWEIAGAAALAAIAVAAEAGKKAVDGARDAAGNH